MTAEGIRINLTMSTKLPDLLDRDGQASAQLSSRGRNLVNFLGEIVRSVSGSREFSCSDWIQCRKYISKKRCAGSIGAWCKDRGQRSPIEWHCWECGEGGLIYDWQGSQFDQKELRGKREHEHLCKGVWLNEQRLDEIQMSLEPQAGNKSISSLRYPSHRIVFRKYDGEAVRISMPPFLAVELFRREIISPNGNLVTLKLGDGDSKPYRFSEVKYLNSSGSKEVVELEFLSEISSCHENVKNNDSQI